MLCDECKKRNATIHMTKIVNQQKIEKHLCDQCAREQGELAFYSESGFSVHDFITGLLQTGMTLTAAEKEEEAACPNCKMRYSDFSEHGKIGCSTCYSFFAAQVEPLIKRIHGSAVHTGKIPKRGGVILENQLKIKRLRQVLERCVEHEEYEEAARLRDEIRLIEKGAQSAVAGGEG